MFTILFSFVSLVFGQEKEISRYTIKETDYILIEYGSGELLKKLEELEGDPSGLFRQQELKDFLTKNPEVCKEPTLFAYKTKEGKHVACSPPFLPGELFSIIMINDLTTTLKKNKKQKEKVSYRFLLKIRKLVIKDLSIASLTQAGVPFLGKK